MKQARVPVLALALALTTPAWSMGYGDHVTSDRVTRDRYTDKYLTQPGAAEAIQRHGQSVSEDLSTQSVGGQPPARTPQIPNQTGPARRSLITHDAAPSASDPYSDPNFDPKGSSIPATTANAAPSSAESASNQPPARSYSQGFHEPLINGVKALAPSDCRLSVQDGVQDTDVSWQGNGRPWTEALSEMVNQAGLYERWLQAPCAIGIATSAGMAQRLASAGRSGTTDASNSTPPEHHASMTYQEYLNQYVSIDLHSASLQEIFSAIAPHDWDVRIEVDNEKLLQDTWDITAENTRTQVVSSLEQQLRVKTQPYPEQQILVVTELKEK